MVELRAASVLALSQARREGSPCRVRRLPGEFWVVTVKLRADLRRVEPARRSPARPDPQTNDMRFMVISRTFRSDTKFVSARQEAPPWENCVNAVSVSSRFGAEKTGFTNSRRLRRESVGGDLPRAMRSAHRFRSSVLAREGKCPRNNG